MEDRNALTWMIVRSFGTEIPVIVIVAVTCDRLALALGPRLRLAHVLHPDCAGSSSTEGHHVAVGSVVRFRLMGRGQGYTMRRCAMEWSVTQIKREM